MHHFKRPTPLTDELLDERATSQQLASSGRGPMLLGRAGGASGLQSPLQLKPSGGDALRTPVKPPTIAECAPLSLDDIMQTPIATTPGAMLRWPFTPMATPSPSARMAVLDQLRLALGTPVGGSAGSLCGGGGAGAPGPPPPAAAAPSVGPLLSTTPGDSLVRSSLDAAAMPPSERPIIAAGAAVAAAVDADDIESDRDGPVVPAPPRPDGALHPSVGSAGHDAGACRRCCFFPRGRCANGYECQFCHYEHEKPKRKHRSRRGAGSGAAEAEDPEPRPPLAAGLAPFARMLQPPPPAAMNPLAMPPMVRQLPGGMCCLVQPAPMAVMPQWGAPAQPQQPPPVQQQQPQQTVQQQQQQQQQRQVITLAPAMSQRVV